MLLHPEWGPAGISLGFDLTILLESSGAIRENILDRAFPLESASWVGEDAATSTGDVFLPHRESYRRDIEQGFLHRVDSQAVGIIHHARIHLVVRSDILPDLAVKAPIRRPSGWVGGLLHHVLDKNVSVRVHVGGKPVAKGGKCTYGACRTNRDRPGVDGSRGRCWRRAVQSVANGGTGRVRGDHQLKGVAVKATVRQKVGVLDDTGKCRGTVDGTRCGALEEDRLTSG